MKSHLKQSAPLVLLPCWRLFERAVDVEVGVCVGIESFDRDDGQIVCEYVVSPRDILHCVCAACA